MDFLASNSQLLLEKSMGFLWTKQAALLDNVANAETPNYKAKVVTFEDSLRVQLERAAGGKSTKPQSTVRRLLEDAEVAVFEPPEAARMDENGINVNEQMVEAVRNAYQIQYVMQSISNNLTVLRTAVRGQ